MSEWSEKDMDQLFQQGSERYDFEYNPAAWEQMERLLERRRRRWLWWLFGGGAMALLVGAFFLSDNSGNNEVGSSEKSINETVLPQAEQFENSDVAGVEFQTIEPEKTTDIKEANKPGELLPDEPTAGGKLEAEPIKPAIPQQQEVSTSSIEKYISETVLPETVSDGSQVEWRPASPNPKLVEVEESLVREDALAHDSATQNGGRAAPPLFALQHLPAMLILVQWQAEKLDSLPAVFCLKNENEASPLLPKNNAFIIGLGGGAEWNSVGFGDFSEQNWKFGVHMKYCYRERFSIGLGANFIRMDYEAGQGEYVSVEDNFWVNGVEPNSTTGLCDMLEIPLEFSYYFKGYRNNGFFASAGLNSYWILEEHYWYNYENPNPDLVFYWGTEKDERHWLNLGFASFGYQKKLSPRTSISLAPYIQFPLTGVGHGAVKIYSIGFQTMVDFQVGR